MTRAVSLFGGLTALITLIGAGVALAEPAPHIIEAGYAASVPRDADAAPWAEATPSTVTLYRQRTVRLRDKNVNARLDSELGPRTAEVKALYSDTEFGLQITWADASRDQLESTRTDAFGDSVAVQIPQRFGNGISLPYVGMGDIDHPVVVALKRARDGAEHDRQFVAAGFGSLTPIEINTEMKLAYDEAGKRWRAVFVRPLEDHNVDLAQGLVPVGMAIWDGGEAERGGNKSLAPWRFVRLGKHPLDAAYMAYVSWGEDGKPIGDAAKGEAIAKAQCVACHHFADQKAAPPGIAPVLHNIGGYALARYLEESIKAPSAIIMPELNPNRHYDKAGQRDKHGAYPNSTLYTWSIKGADGKYMSKMPPFAHLPAEDLANLVAYLKTIKDPLKKGAN